MKPCRAIRPMAAEGRVEPHCASVIRVKRQAQPECLYLSSCALKSTRQPIGEASTISLSCTRIRITMTDLSAFPITAKWPAQFPDRIQLYSLPTPNGVKVSVMLEEN